MPLVELCSDRRSIGAQYVPLFRIPAWTEADNQLTVGASIKITCQQQLSVPFYLGLSYMTKKEKTSANNRLKVVDQLIDMFWAYVRDTEGTASLGIGVACPGQKEGSAFGHIRWVDKPLAGFRLKGKANPGGTDFWMIGNLIR